MNHTSRTILLLSFCALLAASGHAATGDVSMVGVPAAPTPTLPFQIEVYVDTGASLLGAYGLTVFWDPTKVSYLSVTAGTSGMGPPFVVNPMPDNVRFNDVDVFGVGPGTLHVATINFVALLTCTGDPGITGTVDSLGDELGGPLGAPPPRPMIPPTLTCPPPAPPPLCGDCDGNGMVNILDAAAAAQAAVGLAEILPANLGLCDVAAQVDVDTISALDALEIARYVAGLIPSLSCNFAPSCAITQPVAGIEMGDVNVLFDTVDPDAALLSVALDFSSDSGATWAPATPAGTSPFPYDVNPVPATPPGSAQFFRWNSAADIPGAATVFFRVAVSDGVFASACAASFDVDNTLGIPVEIAYVDPAAHIPIMFPGTDESSVLVSIPFSFPYWATPGASLFATNFEPSSNGALRIGPGATPGAQAPLWTYGGGGPTIHAHGADGLTGTVFVDIFSMTQAVFTWQMMDYSGPSPGNWTVQLVLLPNGDFQIRQVQATTDAGRTITIGYSDGSAADNSIPGATGLDWDTVPLGVPGSVGHVDIGSSEPGGMATGRVIYFQFHPVNGYRVFRLQ